MVSTHPLISKSSSPFSNPLVMVPRVPITIGINVTFIFHSFFNSLARSRYLSFFSFSFNFTQWSVKTATSTILQVLFLLIIIRSGPLAEIRWSVCMSKSHRSLCVFKFHLYFEFFAIFYRVFTQDLGWSKVVIKCIEVFYFLFTYLFNFYCLFWEIFLTGSFGWYFLLALWGDIFYWLFCVIFFTGSFGWYFLLALLCDIFYCLFWVIFLTGSFGWYFLLALLGDIFNWLFWVIFFTGSFGWYF